MALILSYSEPTWDFRIFFKYAELSWVYGNPLNSNIQVLWFKLSFCKNKVKVNLRISLGDFSLDYLRI